MIVTTVQRFVHAGLSLGLIATAAPTRSPAQESPQISSEELRLAEEQEREECRDRRQLRRQQRQALSYWTIGATRSSPQVVTPPVDHALSIDADFDLGGFVFKDGAPFLHNDGGATYANTALGLHALDSSTLGDPVASSGSRNTALGFRALTSNTSGTRNTATGAYALASNMLGHGNTAAGAYALYSNTTGQFNSAFGASALYYNTSGWWNTASGAFALSDSATGHFNSASGFAALSFNTTGHSNTAGGALALGRNTTGSQNTAFGSHALGGNRTGTLNTAIGASAMRFIDGSRNVAVGFNAGSDGGVGSDNIWISSVGGYPDPPDSNTLRIGAGTGAGNFQQNRAFISGVRNATLNLSNEQQVCVDDADQVGPCSISSARFKYDIQTMGNASRGMSDLRPVVFKYRPDVKEDAETEHFGLIAEEVAEIYPHLVTTDANGKPFSVRYDLLTPLLLNELQKAQDQIALLEKRMQQLEDLVTEDP